MATIPVALFNEMDVWAAGAQRLGTLYGKAREPMRKGSAAWADALGRV